MKRFKKLSDFSQSLNEDDISTCYRNFDTPVASPFNIIKAKQCINANKQFECLNICKSVILPPSTIQFAHKKQSIYQQMDMIDVQIIVNQDYHIEKNIK